MEPSKYRPISLLNMGGKVLEELLINRINHHMYKNELLIDSKYGFTPKRVNRCSYGGKKIHRSGTRKRYGCYNDQLKRQRSIQRSVVAKRLKGVERCRMPYKLVLP